MIYSDVKLLESQKYFNEEKNSLHFLFTNYWEYDIIIIVRKWKERKKWKN